MSMSALGNAIVRPASMPRLGNWLKNKTATFKVDPKAGNVSLVA
jgi:hypothetical protein